jgi:hypothetical protein
VKVNRNREEHNVTSLISLLCLCTLFFIRNQFIRNWTLHRQKCWTNKKLCRAVFSFLRNLFLFFCAFFEDLRIFIDFPQILAEIRISYPGTQVSYTKKCTLMSLTSWLETWETQKVETQGHSLPSPTPTFTVPPTSHSFHQMPKYHNYENLTSPMNSPTR